VKTWKSIRPSRAWSASGRRSPRRLARHAEELAAVRRRGDLEHAARPDRDRVGEEARRAEPGQPEHVGERAAVAARHQVAAVVELEAGAAARRQDAAERPVLLDHQDPAAVRGEQAGGDRAADPAADDDRVVAGVAALGAGGRHRHGHRHRAAPARRSRAPANLARDRGGRDRIVPSCLTGRGFAVAMPR
jgi:hypothetical protein